MASSPMTLGATLVAPTTNVHGRHGSAMTYLASTSPGYIAGVAGAVPVSHAYVPPPFTPGAAPVSPPASASHASASRPFTSSPAPVASPPGSAHLGQKSSSAMSLGATVVGTPPLDSAPRSGLAPGSLRTKQSTRSATGWPPLLRRDHESMAGPCARCVSESSSCAWDGLRHMATPSPRHLSSGR